MTWPRISTPILLAIIVAALSLPIAISAQRMADAEGQLTIAHASLKTADMQRRQIIDLRDRTQVVAERKRPEHDVIARVNAALAEVGIPSRHFGAVTSEGDSPITRGAGAGGANAGGLRRQSLRIALRDLPVPQLGAFLAEWNRTQPLWTPTRIELTHVRASAANTARYDAVLIITATYVAH